MRFILERKHYGTLYHFTPLSNLYSIVKDNEIISEKLLIDLYQDDVSAEKRFQALEKKYEHYISTTRNKHLYKKNHGILNFLSCRISFDTDKLTDRYKVIPVNYFSYSTERMYTQDEDEEAILLPKGQHKIEFKKYTTTVSLPSYELFLKEVLSYKEDYRYMFDMLTDYITPKLNLGRNQKHVYELLKSSIEKGKDKHGIIKDVYEALIKEIQNMLGDRLDIDYLS